MVLKALKLSSNASHQFKFARASDRDLSTLVTAVALRGLVAIENDDQTSFEVSVHCLGVILSLTSAGKFELWEGGTLPNELVMIRKAYMKTLQGSHHTTWPSYLFIFHLAYYPMTQIWVEFLINASADLDWPSKVWLHETIFRPKLPNPLTDTNLLHLHRFESLLQISTDFHPSERKSVENDQNLTLDHVLAKIRNRIAFGLKMVAGLCCLQSNFKAREKPVYKLRK